MTWFEFKDPSRPVAIPFWTRLRSAASILLRRRVPIRWLFSVPAWAARVKAWTHPARRKRLEGVLKPLMPPGTSKLEVRRQVRLCRAITYVAHHSYAPAFRRSREWLLSTFRPEGLEYLDELKAGGQGAVVVATHVGLNDWMASVLRGLGCPMRPTQRQTVSAESLLLMQWEGVASDVLPFPDASAGGVHLKRLYDLINEGVWIEHAGDYPDHEYGLGGTYLGAQVRCVRAPWVLARLSGVPVIAPLLLVDRNRSPKLVVGRPIYVERGLSPDAAMTRALQAYLDFVGAHVSRLPWNLHLQYYARLVGTS